MLAQNQDADLDFQKECLRLLKQAVEKQEADYRNYAYLLDRVCMNEGNPQVYGTQGIQKENKFVPYLLQDQECVDQRSLKVGLGSLEKYKEDLKKAYNLEDTDFE